MTFDAVSSKLLSNPAYTDDEQIKEYLQKIQSRIEELES